MTFIAFLLVSLHWALGFSRSHYKRFLSFHPWSTRGDHTKKSRHECKCEESHSACNNTLGSAEEGMFCFPFFPCYCVFINMLETLVTYPERDFNSVRLQVIKEYAVSFRLREKNNFFARKNIFVVKAPSNSSLVSISRHCDLETIGAFTFFPFYCNFRPLCL